jgi:hypothetical protein
MGNEISMNQQYYNIYSMDNTIADAMQLQANLNRQEQTSYRQISVL